LLSPSFSLFVRGESYIQRPRADWFTPFTSSDWTASATNIGKTPAKCWGLFFCGSLTSYPMVQSPQRRAAVSLSPAPCSVIAARPPRNGQLGGILGPDTHSRRGLSFHAAKARSARLQGRKKALVLPVNFPGRTGRPPFVSGSVGTKVKNRITSSFAARSTTQRLLSKKTARMGDKAKPLASLSRRLCCL